MKRTGIFNVSEEVLIATIRMIFRQMRQEKSELTFHCSSGIEHKIEVQNGHLSSFIDVSGESND